MNKTGFYSGRGREERMLRENVVTPTISFPYFRVWPQDALFPQMLEMYILETSLFLVKNPTMILSTSS